MRGKRRRQNEERILFSSVLITVQINYFCFATCFIVEYISVPIIFSKIAKTCDGESVKFLISSSNADEGTYTFSSLLNPRQKFPPPITLSTKRYGLQFSLLKNCLSTQTMT